MYMHINENTVNVMSNQVDGAVILNKENLQKLTGGQLVQVFNHITNKNIKKFDSKDIGIDRIMKHLDNLETNMEKTIEEHENATTSTEVVEAAPATQPEITEEAAPAPKKRGRKPNGAKVVVEKKPKKISKEARLVHLFMTNPGVPISRELARATFENLPEGSPELQNVKTASFSIVLSYIRNPDAGFGMRIEKDKDDNLIYVPEKNSQVAFEYALPKLEKFVAMVEAAKAGN